MVGFLHETTGDQIVSQWWSRKTDVLPATQGSYTWDTRLSDTCQDSSKFVEILFWDKEVYEAIEPGTMLGGSVVLGSGSVGV